MGERRIQYHIRFKRDCRAFPRSRCHISLYAKKHSEGTIVNVTVEGHGDIVIAQIADNGKGIDDLHTRRSGTKNMERRLTRQHGTLQLKDNPTGGLIVLAKIPGFSFYTDELDG